MSRLVEVLATGTVAVFLLAGAAHADSRLFSARSDKNGITVTGASLNGKELPVAGQGGGVTFFRIDNPGGSVSCTSRIAFTGSNGQVATFDANICANGAQVMVPFSTASESPSTAKPPKPTLPAKDQQPAAGQPPSSGQPPATGQPSAGAQPAGTQAVTISLDDPNVTIDGVFMGGKPVAIHRRLDHAVEVLVAPGKDGIACSSDLGLVLSDGRRIARAVDICANDRKVSVTLLSAGGTATSAPPTQPQPPATAGAAAPASSDAVWAFSSTRNNGSLIFGVPQTDGSEFMAICEPASKEATISLERSAPGVRPGGAVTVNFSAGAFAQNYRATGSDVSQVSGLSNPLIKVKTDDPLWQAIIRESALTIRIGSAPPYSLPLKGSAAKARQFLGFCNPAPPAAPPVVAGPPVVPAPPGFGGPPVPVPDSGAIPFACDDGSYISVVFDDASARAIVTEGGGGVANVLHRVGSNRGARYIGDGDVLVGYAETITWSRGGSYPASCRPQ
jgi:hypothetical protein